MSVIQNDLDPDVLIGLQLPLGVHQNGVFKQTQTLLEQTKSNIRNLLLTRRGERLGNPTFGSNLMRVLFEPNEPDVLKVQVEETINESLSEFLPFVTLVETQVTNDGHTLNIVAQFDTEFTEEIIEVIIPFASALADETAGGGTGGY